MKPLATETNENGNGVALGDSVLAVVAAGARLTPSDVGVIMVKSDVGGAGLGVGRGEVRSPHPMRRIGIKNRSRRINKL